MRHAWKLAALTATGLLAAGAAAPAALAADDCPNAAVRAQQGVQHLPHCMAYEKLTPPNKNGAPVGAEFMMNDDGSEMWVYSGASIVPGTTSGLSTELLAKRGSDGWSLESLLDTPGISQRRNTQSSDYPQVYAFQGLRRILFTTFAPIDPGDVGGGSAMVTNDLYIREEDGTFRWLTKPEGFTYAPHDPAEQIELLKISPDLTTIMFGGKRVMNPAIDSVERSHVWMWRDGKPYELIDRMPDGSLSTTTNSDAMVNGVRLFGASPWVSPDFKTAAWLSRVRVGRVTTDNLYVRVGVGTPQARTLEVAANASGTVRCPSNPGFLGVTLDGRYVRFGCPAQLTDDAPSTGGAYFKDTQTEALLYDDGTVDRPTTLDSPPSSWTRPDGSYRLEPRAEGLWSVHLPSGAERCVTCFGPTPTQADVTGGYGVPSLGGIGTTRQNFITPEGDVFFTSTQQLVPEDTNAFSDLYISIDGKPYLLTGGDASRDIQMGGVSLDGSTASFVTTSTLLAEDQDGGGPDVYVLRRNGGFLRTEPPAPCSAGCQGPALPVNALTAPLSVSFPDVGDLADEGSDPIAVSGSRTVRGASVKLKVSVPAKGRVTASGSGLRATSKSASKASTVTVTVKLSERSQRTLRRKGSVKVKASVRFVPADGSSQSKRLNLTFRQKKTAKKKGASRSVAAAPSGKAAR